MGWYHPLGSSNHQLFPLVRSQKVAYKEGDHSLGVHALSDVELVVLEVGNDLLGECLGVLLENGDSVGVGLLELGLDGLHVTLEVG